MGSPCLSIARTLSETPPCDGAGRPLVAPGFRRRPAARTMSQRLTQPACRQLHQSSGGQQEEPDLGGPSYPRTLHEGEIYKAMAMASRTTSQPSNLLHYSSSNLYISNWCRGFLTCRPRPEGTPAHCLPMLVSSRRRTLERQWGWSTAARGGGWFRERPRARVWGSPRTQCVAHTCLSIIVDPHEQLVAHTV